jgi:hypothetical protein
MAKQYTYDDPSRRESLLDVITNIDPVENQFQAAVSKSHADNIVHEWVIDTLNPAGVNAWTEGSDATFASRVNPARGSNRTQIIRRDFEVTDTQREVNHAGFEDAYAYQMDKAETEWSNDLEFALLRGTLATGTGSAARQMAGLKSVITTNATTVNTGVTFSEDIFNNLIELADIQGGKPNLVMVPSRLKRRISSFTAGTTKNIDSDEKKLINSVGVYESDFGVHKIVRHRYVTASGDANFDIIGVQTDKYALAPLRETKHVPLAKTGSSTKGMIEGEVTLEYKAEKSSFLGKNYS